MDISVDSRKASGNIQLQSWKDTAVSNLSTTEKKRAEAVNMSDTNLIHEL